MIEYKNNENGVSLKLNGNGPELTAEVTMMISAVYGAIHEEDKIAAEAFRYTLLQSLVDENMADTIWSEKLSKNAIKLKVDEDMLKKTLKALANMIDDDDDDEDDEDE